MLIAIVDYSMGNIHSVHRKLIQLKVNTVVASTPESLAKADKIILPGVGHFAKAMENLKSRNLYEVLNEQVLIKKVPILGICLGMQLMARASEEGGQNGLGWIHANVVRFQIKEPLKFKVPQTGWNTVTLSKKDELMKDVPDESEFYFLHSYHYQDTPSDSVLTTTNFQYEYVSAVAQENIFGTQFHPEKSHEVGMQVFKNFCRI